MTYNVTLDVFQGANLRPDYQMSYEVEERGPLSAMSKAEQHVNVQLPDNQYAVARYALIPFNQKMAASPLKLAA